MPDRLPDWRWMLAFVALHATPWTLAIMGLEENNWLFWAVFNSEIFLAILLAAWFPKGYRGPVGLLAQIGLWAGVVAVALPWVLPWVNDPNLMVTAMGMRILSEFVLLQLLLAVAWRLGLGELTWRSEESSPGPTGDASPAQFQILHLLAWTAVIALALAAVRVLVPFLFEGTVTSEQFGGWLLQQGVSILRTTLPAALFSVALATALLQTSLIRALWGGAAVFLFGVLILSGIEYVRSSLAASAWVPQYLPNMIAAAFWPAFIIALSLLLLRGAGLRMI